MTEESFVQFKLRLPESMRNRLELASAESGRSLSAEILFRLDATLPRTAADLRLRELRTAAWEAEAALDLRRHELASHQRVLRSLDKDHRDRSFYITQATNAQAGVDRATERRNHILQEIAKLMAPMDHE